MSIFQHSKACSVFVYKRGTWGKKQSFVSKVLTPFWRRNCRRYLFWGVVGTDPGRSGSCLIIVEWAHILFILFFNQMIIVLQCCVGFCYTRMWISHNYIYIYPRPLEPPSGHIFQRHQAVLSFNSSSAFWFCFLIIYLLFILATLGFPCGSRASHCSGFCCCGAQTLGQAGFSNCDTRAMSLEQVSLLLGDACASWRWSPTLAEMERRVVSLHITPGGLISPDSKVIPSTDAEEGGAMSVPGAAAF